VESQTLVHAGRPTAREGWDESPGSDALVLGRYRLLERLGAGGFGVVWRARDEQLHREVALKRIPLAPEEDSERATREALASARLAHPAIVALYEACAVQDAFYLISELVDGVTLARLIAEDALADRQALQIGVALCSALAHAHSRGVIHRDVKPHNVLIPSHADGGDAAARTPTGEALGEVAKLTDFGGARLSGGDALTRTGDVLGTLAYMAPEQSEGRAVGEPADLYSLALVLYEALSGANPVRGATPAQTVRRIGRPIPSLARQRRDLPRSLAHAVDRALAPAPRARGTLHELCRALEQALDGDSPRTVRERRPRERPASQPPPPAEQQSQVPRQIHDLPASAHAQLPLAAGRALPRLVWLAGAVALAVWQTASGRPGLGLLALAALLPIVLVPVGRRAQGGSGGWLLCALAPALGLAGLAGAFPAIAGQAARWRMRAALGALGYWWLALAEPLVARHLWLGPPTGTPARAAWEGSLDSAAVHVVGPLLSLGALLGAALWAGAAVLLPLLVRGRSAALDVVAATVWSAAIAAAVPLVAGGSSAYAAHASPRGAVVGAVLGGALAVAARALRGPV
jgi:eukaryotic-like serine/threonine-protein kinase